MPSGGPDLFRVSGISSPSIVSRRKTASPDRASDGDGQCLVDGLIHPYLNRPAKGLAGSNRAIDVDFDGSHGTGSRSPLAADRRVIGKNLINMNLLLLIIANQE